MSAGTRGTRCTSSSLARFESPTRAGTRSRRSSAGNISASWRCYAKAGVGRRRRRPTATRAFVLALGRAQFERSEFEFRAFAEALETAAKSKYGDEAAVFEDDDDSAGDSGEGGGPRLRLPWRRTRRRRRRSRALRSLDDFTLHAVLGLGAFGKVYLASPKRWPADASPSAAPRSR